MTVESFELRDAVPGDAAALTDIAMRSKAVWGYSAEFMAACEDELTVTPTDIEGDSIDYFVASENGTVIGYTALDYASAPHIELEALFVDPDRIGMGVGHRLLEHAVKSARRRGGQSLVIQADPHAVDFYTAAGARVLGTRESGSVAGRHLPLLEIEL